MALYKIRVQDRILILPKDGIVKYGVRQDTGPAKDRVSEWLR